MRRKQGARALTHTTRQPETNAQTKKGESDQPGIRVFFGGAIWSLDVRGRTLP